MRSDIVWTALPWSSVEHVTIDGADGWTADGAMVAAFDGQAVRLAYRLQVDAAGATRALDLADAVGGATRSLRGDGHGRWCDADGVAIPELDDCIDVDISTTPLTNTLPVRRLRLAPGESAEIKVAYVDVPSLAVRPAAQTYRRIDDRSYRYASGSFTAEVVFDEHDLVTDYVGLWQRVPIAVSR
ncbi:MAG TPA: putative glycolipid-binding domain-containing protein [Micromonosporaceae bacterium]